MSGSRTLILCCYYLGLSLAVPPPLDVTKLEAFSPGCQDDLNTLRQGNEAGQFWAEAILDASVKSPAGLLSQTAVQFGDFDECLQVSAPFSTQFCLVEVSPASDNGTNWQRFRWGVCVPSSCSQDLQHSMQTYMDKESEGVLVKVIPAACTTRDTMSRDISTNGVVYCLVMLLVFLTVAAATTWDFINRPKYDVNSNPGSLADCLSARRGWHSLWKPDDSVPGVKLGCLFGLHALATFFIVLGHRFSSLQFMMSLTNYRYVEHIFQRSWLSLFATHMDLFVDLFFFMSAFTLALLYKTKLQDRLGNPLLVCFYRYFRITPVFAVVVFFYATLLYQLGDGPVWNLMMKQEEELCANYWWTSLLFINNYVEKFNTCIVQTWYLSCDMQLFVLGVFIIFLLHKNARWDNVVLVTGFLASTVAIFLGTYLYKRQALMVFDRSFLTDPRHHDYFTSVYSQAHYRGTSYFPGLIAGCYVYRNKGTTLSKTWTNFLQSGGLIIFLVIFCSGYPFSDLSNRPSHLIEAIYASLSHSLFGLGLALIIVSCALGTPTILSSALSWKGFVPLSKLSYCVYLTHLIPQFVTIASSRTPVYFNFHEVVSWTIADVVLMLIVALVLYLSVETPARYVIKYLFTGPTIVKRSRKKGTIHSEKH